MTGLEQWVRNMALPVVAHLPRLARGKSALYEEGRESKVSGVTQLWSRLRTGEKAAYTREVSAGTSEFKITEAERISASQRAKKRLSETVFHC